jgi:tetratricopeptide (TPR) repeat protein
MSLRQALRSGVAAACIASVALPAGAEAPIKHAGVEVRVAEAGDYSHVEVRGAAAAIRREGQTIILRLTRDADPDIARLHTDPPKWIKTAEKRHVGGHLELAITLADDADAKTGTADGAVFVNAFAKPPPDPKEIAKAQAEKAAAEAAAKPNPVPAGGTVKLDPKFTNTQVQLTFAWVNPVGAAVFRRGDAVWIVFDAAANLDVSNAPRGLRQYTEMQAYRGQGYSAVRIEAAHDVPVFATQLGNSWTIALGPGDQPQSSIIRVTRDEAEGPAVLKAPVAGATEVLAVADPNVGDTLSVVTALGPSKGLGARRDYVQLALLPSIQGLAIASHIEDLTVSREGDLIHIGRPAAGLALSANWATRDKELADMGAPAPAAIPGLIDYDNWGRTGSGGFLARYNSLLGAASAEHAKTGPTTVTGARLALARFLVGKELSFEAIGVLNEAAHDQPRLLDDPEYRALRGVARVMARRYKEADADFSSPVLVENSAAALWRSYIAAQGAQWAEARSQFAKGAEAFNQFPAVWKQRFARADAQAAMAQGDLVDAQARIRQALQEQTEPAEQLSTRLIQARLIELQGHKDRALRVYQAIARAPAEYLSAPALLRSTQIQLEAGKITPVQAAGVFDNLRYRWRGDATELETIRALGQLYLAQGHYREALEALRSAGKRLPDLPEALQLQADLNAAFRTLFLDGSADGLEPIQALALFYDFKELTPVGADGDAMVRKMVRRLVDVDLLDQAAELLKYQVDSRLEGVPKAQVATDLALIYLMDKKPEQAIQAINSSRTTVLPRALNDQRRVIEARAWAGVGRYDSAIEILDKDQSKDAQDLRAEIAWRQKNWAQAGPLYEKSLGDRFKTTATPLSADEEGRLLRAGVAFSLAGDEASLTRLHTQYAAFLDAAHNPEALKIALTGLASGHLSVADFGRVTADNEVFSGWVDKMKARFRAEDTATPKPAPQPAGPKRTAQGPSAALKG